MFTLTPPDDASDDQVRAVEQLERWLKGSRQQITLGGLAGSGKSTLIRSIKDSLESQHVSVAVAALSGKAVSVLRGKGIYAETLHSLLYEPEGPPKEWVHAREAWKGSVKRLLRQGKYPNARAVEEAAEHWMLGDHYAQVAWVKWQQAVAQFGEHVDTRVIWVEVEELAADVVIVDEASMVDFKLYESLVKHDVRLLFVGDHGQLEPIGDNPRLMSNPEIRLETIHRQAAGSEIIQFAHFVREGHDPRHWRGTGKDVTVNPRDVRYSDFDVVLCGYNRFRTHLNQVVRTERGIQGVLPRPNERLICLQNSKNAGLFNGFMCDCIELRHTDDPNIAKLTVENSRGDQVTVDAWVPQFGEPSRAPYIDKTISMFDWGYALTVHKSQGSEWPHVAVVEQISRNWMPERWRYTAATRASHHLTYLS